MTVDFLTDDTANNITGSNYADLIIALSGSDTADGGDGDDTIHGNQGDDSLLGGRDQDYIRGGQGNDYINGNIGSDTIYGDLGDDSLRGGNTSDTVFGGQGRDIVYGDLASDKLYGDRNDDIIYGGQGVDTLFGGEGADTLSGDRDSDDLYSNTETSGDNSVDVFLFNDNSGGDHIQYIDSGDIIRIKAFINGIGLADEQTLLDNVTFIAGDGNTTPTEAFINLGQGNFFTISRIDGQDVTSISQLQTLEWQFI